MSDLELNFDGPTHASVDEAALLSAIQAEGAEVEPEPTVVVDNPAVATKAPEAEIKPEVVAAEAQTAEVVAPTQPETFKVIVDGNEVEVTKDDLLSGYMRHRDYTQKTQTLSEQRKQIEAERQQIQSEVIQAQQTLQQLDQFLQNPEAVQNYLAKTFGAPKTPAMTLEDISSPEQMTAFIQQNVEQVRTQMQQQLAIVQAEAKRNADLAMALHASQKMEEVKQGVYSHLDTVLKEYPELTRFEDIREQLIEEAGRYAPATLAAARQELSKAAERRATVIRGLIQDNLKKTAADAAALRKTTAEPTGGAAPRQAAKQPMTLESKDRNNFLAENEAFLKELLQS